jgi:SSS family solute:Na+ symporter
MTWIDWSIMAFPMFVVCFIAYKTHKYVKGVSDFLSAGRVAGRYLVCTAAGMAGMGVVSVVAAFETYYKSGFAFSWWIQLGTPVGLLVTLTGFVIYRYRETRAMTLAQFFEMRYSRRFRIYAGLLAAGAGIVNYGIFPAVGGRFFVYFCGLPEQLHLGGFAIPTFAIVMAVFLGMSLAFVLIGGQLTIMVTDCVQGLFSYAMYLVVALTLLYIFSWHQISTALMTAPAGQSLINPFRSFKVEDFNIWFQLIGIFGGVYIILAWQGTQGFNCSAASAHEQKMGGILGGWRGLVFEVMQTLLAVCALTYLTHGDFLRGAGEVRDLVTKIHGSNPQEAAYLQQQMRVPIALAHFLPIGIKGIFASLMFFLACSNDVSYLHSWGSIVAQDVVMPFRSKPLSPKAHMLLLRLCITGVTIFGFCWSLFYHQVQYIKMYFAVTGAIFLGGAGAVIIGGLYWKKGTTAAAWVALTSGSAVALGGIFFEQYWTGIQPRLINWFGPSDYLLRHADKFPINGQYVNGLSMATAILLYIVVSLLTSREDFNLNRMLHRGQYAVDASGRPAPAPEPPPRTWKALLGIDEHFTRGDKIISALLFAWIMLQFSIFSVISVWNLVHVWPDRWWSAYWYYNAVMLPIFLGTITSIWFTIGGIFDLRKLFRRLRVLKRDVHDDGTVVDGDLATAAIAPQEDALTKGAADDLRAGAEIR